MMLFTDGLLSDGTGLTIAAKAKGRKINVVMFSGHLDAFPREELDQYTVMTEPADMDDVVQTVA